MLLTLLKLASEEIAASAINAVIRKLMGVTV